MDMSAKEMFIDFLNLVFFIVLVGLSILYFIAGDNFENFKILMQSLAPFGLFDRFARQSWESEKAFGRR
jgi:hypothetical protein